jgi:hypothetical protein
VAASRARTQRAEAYFERAATERRRTDALFQQGAVTAARDAARDAEDEARRRFLDAGRMSFADGQRLDAAQDLLAVTTRRNGADVTGTLAVDVTFPDEARGRVAVAAIDLVRGRFAEPGEDVGRDVWDAARRGAHVHLRFPTPLRSVPAMVEGGGMLMAELIVPLPLTREPGGYVLVRDVGRVVRIGRLPADVCVRFQEAIAAAVPVGK